MSLRESMTVWNTFQKETKKTNDFDDIDMPLYFKYTEWMKARNYAINTIGKHIKNLKSILRYASEPEVGERAGWPPHESIEDSIKVIREVFSNGHTFAMELKETGEAIGCIGYYDHAESNIQIGEEDAEIGYRIGKPYWNQGLGTEALRGMVDWCFNKRLMESLGEQ